MRKKKLPSLAICILSSVSISLFFSQLEALSSTTKTKNKSKYENHKTVNHPINKQNKKRDLYGSIAVFGFGSFAGYSWNHPSSQEAIDAALKACFEAGRGKCRTAIWFQNGCGALASAIGSYGAGYGPDELTAQHEALKNCKSDFCRIKKVICNSTK